MEKKQKIAKAIICILTALLIAGCVILMAFLPNVFETKTANAENQNVDNPPTQVSDEFDITGYNNSSYTASQQIIYAENTKSSEESNITLIFKNDEEVNLNDYKEIRIGYTAYCNTDSTVMYVEYGYFDGNRQTKIAQSWLPYSVLYKSNIIKINELQYANTERKKINYIKIQYQNEGTTNSWIQIFKLIFINKKGVAETTNAPYYFSYLENIIQNAQYEGIKNGYNSGYDIGYNAGYQVGYDKGIVSEWKSPIAIFIQPIDSFLSTNIFGSISIGDILSVILFVMVGIIFIKMFAGG